MAKVARWMLCDDLQLIVVVLEFMLLSTLTVYISKSTTVLSTPTVTIKY